ncbi:MAG TPA: Hpt domain-containing protein [Candidatus Acidoferrales bacterium]|nr:Hpt domain-containing protein [Candidatus Acidoferrales bacterium]
MSALLVDKKALLENLANDPALLKEVIGIFLTDSPAQLAAIRAAVAGDNPSEVMKTAHSLKGSVGVFGAVSAVAAAQKLESMGRDRKNEKFGDAFAALEREIALVTSALQEIANEAA